MSKRHPASQLELVQIERTLQVLGRAGVVESEVPMVRDLLADLDLARFQTGGSEKIPIATNRLMALGPTRNVGSAVRRVLSLLPDYRSHLLTVVLESVKQLADDQSLAETLEQLDHLSPELLQLARSSSPLDSTPEYDAWDVAIWQAPDAVTLLAKVVEAPADFAALPTGPLVPVGFDWLSWETPPAEPAPAPWGDSEPLESALKTARHPFWGALVATLDACTGDYEWQSVILRGGLLRSRHRTLGKAEAVIASLWSRELGLYPAAPLILPEDMPFIPGQPLPWLQRTLDQMAEAGIATESEGSWRLTDQFRTELMKDDEHMIAFEAVRQRSFRLAHAAGKVSETMNEVVAS